MRSVPLFLLAAAFATADEPRIASVEVEISGKNDQHEQCAEWASTGECEANPKFMMADCPASCGVKTMATAYVNEGEDSGIGAFRFAEDYHIVEQAELVLNVAKQLLERLADAEYTPPKELTHCGKRLCSAGKLWKRAEEMRKEDMHDAAGADFIRALSKTGIEVDFIERCQRSLQWAFGSISRQREREQRELIEEEKFEKRRQEEREATEEAIKRKEEYEADFVKFGMKLQESLANPPENVSATVDADGNVEEDNTDELDKLVKETFVKEGPQGGNWDETIQLIKKISSKSTDILLIEARCYEIQGNYKFALSAAGRLIQKAANYDPWINDSPRMMAATLGANAAMQLGLSENAISFYQTVLKFDPEQARARKQYRGLKKVVKLMDKAEEQVRTRYHFMYHTFCRFALIIHFSFCNTDSERLQQGCFGSCR